MRTVREANLRARERRKLREARENGYLDARGAGLGNLLMVFSLWCWRLRLPVVWLERCSPRSRYGTARLDLYTTANRLTGEGQAERRGLAPGAVDISPHDARWRVRLAAAEELAGRVLKAALKAGNSECAVPRVLEVEHRGPAKVLEFGNGRRVLTAETRRVRRKRGERLGEGCAEEVGSGETRRA